MPAFKDEKEPGTHCRKVSALSARRRIGQGGALACGVLEQAAMLKYALPAALLAASATALAVPGGPIGALPPASYACEMPGDATGAAGYRVDAENFTVINSNAYRTVDGRGTYLLTGDLLVLTSGPKRGQKYRKISNNFLRKLDSAGNETPLRCVRRVINNTGSGPACTAPDGTELASCKGKDADSRS